MMRRNDSNPVRRTKATRLLEYDTLESRRLLAGDVRVFFSDSVLVVIGDSDANIVEVSQAASGEVTFTGVDTTINGDATFSIGNNFRHATIIGEAGDDTFRFDGFHSPDNFSFYGRDGNDRLELSDVFASHFHLETGAGNDVVEMANVDSGSSTYTYLGLGDDTLAVNSMVAGRNFKVFGGEGNDTFASADLNVGRKFSTDLGNGNDQAFVTGAFSADKWTRVDLGIGNDVLLLEPDTSVSLNRFEVKSKGGDDTVSVSNSLEFHGKAVIDGGEGSDSVQVGTSQNRVTIENFESQTVSNLQTLRDTVFASLSSQGIDPTPFSGTSVLSNLEISTSPITLEFPEGGDEVSFDSDLTLTPTGSGLITGATVSLVNFDGQQDVITFDNTINILGAFNADTGTLTLTGNDTVDSYQTALRNVLYQNTSDSPTVDDRQVNFLVRVDDRTFTASRTLRVAAVDSPTTLSLSRDRVSVQLSELPVTVDSELTVSDLDSTQISSIVVTIAEGFQADEDELSVVSQSGIVGDYDQATGILTISDPSSDSEITDFEAVLRTLQFGNRLTDNQTAGERTLRFSIVGEQVAEIVVETLSVQ